MHSHVFNHANQQSETALASNGTNESPRVSGWFNTYQGDGTAGDAQPLVQLQPKIKDPFALETSLALKAGDVIKATDLRKSQVRCSAYNPLTGPFSDLSDVAGRVAARDIPAGTIITGAYLLPLAQPQMIARLGNFWRKCR